MEIWCCIRNRSWNQHSQLEEVVKELGAECKIVPYKCVRLCMFCKNLYAFYADGKPILAKNQDEVVSKLRRQMVEESSFPNQSLS